MAVKLIYGYFLKSVGRKLLSVSMLFSNDLMLK